MSRAGFQVHFGYRFAMHYALNVRVAEDFERSSIALILSNARRSLLVEDACDVPNRTYPKGI